MSCDKTSNSVGVSSLLDWVHISLSQMMSHDPSSCLIFKNNGPYSIPCDRSLFHTKEKSASLQLIETSNLISFLPGEVTSYEVQILGQYLRTGNQTTFNQERAVSVSKLLFVTACCINKSVEGGVLWYIKRSWVGWGGGDATCFYLSP